MFWPLLNEPQAAAREHTKGLLDNPANAHFIVYADGKPAGMQTFMRPGFTPPVMDFEHDVYLFEGVVEAKARSGGVGTALLAHSMKWAQEQGYSQCTLHFASGNPSGAPFWLGHGFVPIEYTMVRHVDERVAWANGWETPQL
jgi:GNAT superfamily N-acetyltransferase